MSGASSKKTITIDEVEHLAKLSELPLTDKEKENLQSSLSSIIDYVGEVQSLDIEGIPTTNQVTGKFNELRDDAVEESLSQEKVFASSSVPIHNSFFMVPKILNDD